MELRDTWKRRSRPTISVRKDIEGSGPSTAGNAVLSGLYTEVDNAVTTVDNVPHFPDFWVTGIARKDQPVEFQSGVRI